MDSSYLVGLLLGFIVGYWVGKPDEKQRRKND